MAGSHGSGRSARAAVSRNRAKRWNSSVRPRVTASRSGCAKSQKNRNGLRGAELLAHEEERDRGRQQYAGDRGRERGRRRERADPLAECAVADLVVRLEEVDERGRRQHAARAPAPETAVRGALALVDEPFGQRPPEGGVRVRRVVRVVAVRLARRQNVPGVMRVVIPLRRCHERPAGGVALEVPDFVAIVLDDEVDDAAAARPTLDRARDLGHDVGRRIVGDRVDGV